MSAPVALANEDRPLLGISMMLVAYLCFSFIDAGAKWLAIAGLPAMQLAFMRYFGHFAISTALLVRTGEGWSAFSSPRLPLVVLRGTLLMVSTVLNFTALRYIPLTLTSTILFSAPIIICALSWPLLGERVGIWRWSAIIIGFVGIVIASRPFDESFHWAVLLSLAGAFCFAMYSILTRHLAGVVATDTMQFYSGVVGTMTLLPFAATQWIAPQTAMGWIVLFGIGVFGWMGHQILTKAHSFATATTLTPFAYSFIIYLAVWSYFLFNHLPDQWTITGGAIIIAAGLVIWGRQRHLAQVAMAMPPGKAVS